MSRARVRVSSRLVGSMVKEVVIVIRMGREAYEYSSGKKEPEIGETRPGGSVVVEQMKEGSFRFDILMIGESGR